MGAWPFRGNKGDNYTKITSSTVETPLHQAFDEKFANLTCIVLSNTSASACKVTIKDGISGATRLVAKVAANAMSTFGNGEDVVLEQNKLGNRWTATCESVDSMEITLMFKNN